MVFMFLPHTLQSNYAGIIIIVQNTQCHRFGKFVKTSTGEMNSIQRAFHVDFLSKNRHNIKRARRPIILNRYN